MKSRGFFDDARSYRFLLPTLRRANRRRELLELVSADFVSRSVEAGHFRSAVEQNLAVTIYTAAEELEWASLTRCVELYKACNICFQEKLTDYDLFGRAFMAVRGASALAERLLFDGRPTINALPGLLLCSLCDDAGATPPWDQYLALVKKADSEEARHDEQDWLKYELAKVHGEIRLYGADAFYPRLVAWVNRVLDPPPEFLRGILARLTAIGSAAFLRRLVEDVSLSPEVNGQIRIELASALAREGKASEVAQAATEAIVVTNSVTIAAQGLTLGADKVEAIKCIPSFDDEKVGLNEEYGQPDKAAVRRWVDGIKIAVANDSPTVETAANYVRGIGWYKNWLRFVISLARAEELAKHDPVKAENDTLVALRQLASDTEPFKGKPRACDLYSVRDIIHETVARALRLIHEPANFEEALTSLVEIERGTSTSLGNFPNGPLTGDALLELLLPFVKNADLKDVALAEMTRQLGRIDEGELIYDTVANADLLLSRALADAGDEDAAKQRWQSASVRLCAYGFRADTSIFDLFEGAAALRKIDVGRASRALARTQPLVNAASARTDGKETQYAPAAWVAALAEVDPTAGAFILARSMVRNGGAIDWRYENALEKVIDAVRGQGSPVLEAFIDATFPRRLKAIEEQLSTLGRLAHQDFNLATQLLMLLASKASDTPEVYELVKGFAHQIHATLPVSSTITQPGNRDKKSVLPQADPLDKFRDTPFFPENASPLEIMRSIRTARRSFDEADATEDRLINAFGYRLIEILEGGDQEGAIRLLKVFSRETYFWAGASALAGLGEGLERHGHMHAAAVAFTLAYARSRGGGGYHFLGDEKHLPWLLRAVKISRETASRLLAEEIAYLLSQHGYYAGITHHQLEALASQPETREAAFEAWEAAYEVLNHRLPGNEDDYFVFEKYDPSNTPPWSVDESLFFLLLGRICHPEIGRKITAVAGISKAIENLPEVVGRPLREFFRVDVPVSTAILILQTLISVEQEPFPVTTSIAAELIQLYRSGLFALRAASQLLLERAGLTIDPGRPAVSIEADPPPERKMNAILSIERGKRVRVVGSFWPKFPGIVAGRFHDLWEQVKAHNERAGIRHKAARSRVYSGLPPANFLFWERELFETVFQEVLEGIDIQLWSTGDWHPDFPIWMLGNILPRLPLHIGRLYSRSPRPPLPRPQEQGTRVEATKPLSDGDEYSGWFRCGSFEREILTERIHRVTDEFMAMSSVQFLAAPTVPDSTFMPLAQGNVDVWFERQDVPDVNVHGLTGPAVGLDFLQDWLGNSPLLMLQPYIQSRLKISSSDPWHNRLQMVDESGEVAVILRCWEEKPVGDSVGEEIARLQGCDLIVRPDVFVRMRAVSSHGPFTAIYSSCDKSEGEEDGGNSCAQAADRSETDLPQ
jgi:hypothetical protein